MRLEEFSEVVANSIEGDDLGLGCCSGTWGIESHRGEGAIDVEHSREGDFFDVLKVWAS